MPQINKIRIVNFLFNNRHRMIPDDIYDLGDPDGRKALNTLISLINGGGKTVLIQLMMQPVLPKAKASDRKIESYFTEPKDHCFVLLEWTKDGSSEKLMTGISIAAALSERSENEREQRIKYYTFLANYSDYSDGYNIIDLPLSYNENGNFRAAEYDLVRKAAVKSGGVLKTFNSDEGAQWRQTLEEYGIYQDEWRNIIEPLNSVEGGMTEFFKKFRTSDQLIDSLLIPAIEWRLNDGQHKKENSMAVMLSGYIRQYHSVSEQIEQRDILKKYVSDIDSRRESVKGLWDINDEREKAVGMLFGFSAALKSECSNLEIKQYNINTEIDKLKNKLQHIEFEEVSENYYNAKEHAEEENKKYISAEEKLSELKNLLKETECKLNAQKAAKFYKKILEAENKIKVLENELSENKKSEEYKNLDILGASVKYLAGRELSEYEQKGTALQTESEEYKEKQKQADEILQKAEKAENDAQSELDKANGSYDTYCRETDSQLEKSGIKVIRNFTGSLPEPELQEYLSSAEKELSDIENNIREISDRINILRERKDKIPYENSEVRTRKSELERQRSDAEEEQRKYDSLDEEMRKICSLYNLREESRFSDSVKEYISECIRKVQNEQRQNEFLLRMKNEEIHAAENGSVHVPKAVLEHLEQTGIRYQTCEHYFLSQIENGSVSAERCIEILEKCPAAAYGILLDDREFSVLSETQRPEWLPAAVPIFTMQDMENVLHGRSDGRGLMAFYSEESFRNRENYISALNAQSERLNEFLEQLKDRGEMLLKQKKIAEQFIYDEQWHLRQEKAISELSNEISKCGDEISRLENEKNKLEKELSDNEINKNQLSEKEKKAEKHLSALKEIIERLQKEEEFSQNVNSAKIRHDSAAEEFLSAQKSAYEIEKHLDELKNNIDQNNEICSDIKNTIDSISYCSGEPQHDGDWRGLLTQYNELSENQDKSVTELNKKIIEEREILSEAERELKRLKCEKQDYINVIYSEKEEERLVEETDHISEDVNKQQELCKNCISTYSAAKTRFEEAEKAVSKYGAEPLPTNEIMGNYKERREKNNSEQEKLSKEFSFISQKLKNINDKYIRTNTLIEKIPQPEKIGVVTLEDDLDEQSKKLSENYDAINKKLASEHKKLADSFNKMLSEYHDSVLHSAVENILKTLDNTDGDIYMTLDRQIEANLIAANMQINKINTDLEDFDGTKKDMIHQCVLQGQRIRQGLIDMQKSARVRLSQERSAIELIRFGIPPETDENTAAANISADIEQAVRELSAKLDSGVLTDAMLENAASKIVSSGRLFRKYIGKEQIELRAYKTDPNNTRAEYRTWESTAVDNSGAEKFLVYFAVILSLMNFTRSKDGMTVQETTGVLILDNPFGVITSRHALLPMFRIAEHFRVQLICLSDITKCDITACFQLHIKAAVKSNNLSAVEILTNEGNERIEHGFYRAVQMRL